MFNFSANNQIVLSMKIYDKCNVYLMKDIDTNRCYKIYDYNKNTSIEIGKVYSIFGKINSADKIYLILEKYKEKI